MQKNIWIAAKYLRLSIEDGDKAESESIVNQSILIDNYMKSTSDITIVETFKDDGFSGTDFKRPGFQAMLKAIEDKEINDQAIRMELEFALKELVATLQPDSTELEQLPESCKLSMEIHSLIQQRNEEFAIEMPDLSQAVSIE